MFNLLEKLTGNTKEKLMFARAEILRKNTLLDNAEGKIQKLNDIIQLKSIEIETMKDDLGEISDIALKYVKSTQKHDDVSSASLLECIRDMLEGNTRDCRGGCVVRDKSGDSSLEQFSSRAEAEELLKKFDSKELTLVG